VFELGYFLAPQTSASLRKTVTTPAGEAMLFDPFPQSSQSLLRTPPLSTRVPVQSNR
jgi:hypothetical protein